MQAIIIPGNDNTWISNNWYLSVKKELEKLDMNVIAKDMPDPELARKDIWLPFIEKELQGDEKSILIGHSSGVVAVLRYLETHKAEGAVIVGAYYTHLNDKKEKASGYFDGEWQWDKIKQNCKWIIQFASTDDPYIPIEEARHVRDMLNTEYHEFTDQGHFGADTNRTEFSELVEEIRKKINS
ncbi:RBBP9/YdeN family alpha/beta hydrolase [Candidatus Aenigmatarchaeota archaeon]